MTIELIPIGGIKAVEPGDDLAVLLVEAMASADISLRADDVLVVCQKVVSKAEGRIVRLSEVEPEERARTFADEYGKDPAIVELALHEAREVLRMERGHLITVTGPGWICANSGIDRSNQNRLDEVTLLPLDADASAQRLRERTGALTGQEPAVIITDTFGRPWRLGQIDVAIGAAGLEVLENQAGEVDLSGRPLEHTVLAVADQLAAAVGLLAGKADGHPAALVRGYRYRASEGRAADLVRPPDKDLFR